MTNKDYTLKDLIESVAAAILCAFVIVVVLFTFVEVAGWLS